MKGRSFGAAYFDSGRVARARNDFARCQALFEEREHETKIRNKDDLCKER